MKQEFDNLELIKKAFAIFLDNDLNADSLISLATENNIKLEDLMFGINKYIRRQTSPCMTVEQRNKYMEIKQRKTVTKVSRDVKKQVKDKSHLRSTRLGKEAYEALIESHYDKSVLKPILDREQISEQALMNNVSLYRKRVVEPKPTLEQEILYNDGVNRSVLTYRIIYRLLDTPIEELDDKMRKFKKDELLDRIEKFKNTLASRKYTYQLEILANKIDEVYDRPPQLVDGYTSENVKRYGDAMEEYIMGNFYALTTVLVQNNIATPSFDAMVARHIQSDPKFKAIYDKYMEVSTERQDKFLILLQSIFEKMAQKKNYNLIDLCMDIDTTVDDFLIMINRIAKFKLVSSGVAKNINDMISKYAIGNSKTAMTQEKIDALTYSYNGMALTPELKKEIISFLNKYNAPITAITIILTFEKYVRGEINFSYQM